MPAHHPACADIGGSPGHTPGVAALRSWLGRLASEPHLRRRVLVLAAVFALSFVPMAGTLGYFSSLLLAAPLSLLAALIGVDGVRARVAEAKPAESKSGAEALWRLVGDGLRELAWLLGLSLAPLVVGMLWNVNCDPLGGLAYFVMGPVCAVALGWTAGVTMTLLTRTIGDRPRWQQQLAACVPWLVSTAIGVHRLYFEPVVFAYDPFWGWFSGPIYDEGVEIGRRFLLYRAYNLAAAAAVWLALQASVDGQLRISARRMLSDGPRRARTAVALVLALSCVGIGATAPRWGFTATTQSLAKVLSATRETEHFVIRYMPNSVTAREIDMIAAEHEFAWALLERRLGRAPARKVDSFVFINGKQRGVLLGADKVEVSPPWRQQMYLSQRPWPHDVMHHELAHAFLGDFGDPLLGLPIAGFRFNGALVEGVPTALAPRPQDNLGLHEQAAILDRLDKRPPIATIMGAGFWGAAASRAYTAAGSFVLWLADTRGWPAVAQLYGNAGDFEATFGVPVEPLEREWLEFLRALPLRERDIAAQAQRYQKGSVFRRPCAHRAADLSQASVRAQLHGRRDEALDLQRDLCRLEPDDPGHALRLASMYASFGELADAASLLDELAARDDLTATIEAVIAEQRGDTALLAGQLDVAARHYAAALELGLSEGRRRQLQIKQIGVADPALAPRVAEYFAPFELSDNSEAEAMLRLWTATKIAELPGHRALGNYLLGRQFSIIAAPEPAAEVLALALDPGAGEPLLPGPELQRAALLAQLGAVTQLHEWDRARGLVGQLDALVEGEGHRQELVQWRERIDFYEELVRPGLSPHDRAGLERGRTHALVDARRHPPTRADVVEHLVGAQQHPLEARAPVVAAGPGSPTAAELARVALEVGDLLEHRRGHLTGAAAGGHDSTATRGADQLGHSPAPREPELVRDDDPLARHRLQARGRARRQQREVARGQRRGSVTRGLEPRHVDVGPGVRHPLALARMPTPTQYQRGIVARLPAQLGVDWRERGRFGVGPHDRPGFDPRPPPRDPVRRALASVKPSARRGTVKPSARRGTVKPVEIDPERGQVDPVEPPRRQRSGVHRAGREHGVEARVASVGPPPGRASAREPQPRSQPRAEEIRGELTMPAPDQRGPRAQTRGRELHQDRQDRSRAALDHVGPMQLDQVAQASARQHRPDPDAVPARSRPRSRPRSPPRPRPPKPTQTRARVRTRRVRRGRHRGSRSSSRRPREPPRNARRSAHA